MDWISRFSLRNVSGTSGTLQGDFAKIHANLNREILKVKERTNKGLLLAAIEIRRDMEVTPPLIPVDYGNLKASFFIVTNKTASAANKMMEVRKATFKRAASPEILQELQNNHTTVLAESEIQLSAYPIGVMLGFSAFYAAAVHEMVDSAGTTINWSLPGSGPKFLQSALFRNFDKVVQIVKINAQVP